MDKRLLDIKRKIIPLLKRNGVVKAGIFGSFARGDAKKKSDIDLLVKFNGLKSLLDIVRVERELKYIVGRDVDLLEYEIIHPRLKNQILKEEVKIL